MDHTGCARDGNSIDAGDIGVGLSSCRADANGVGLVSNAFVADIDIVIAGGEMASSYTLKAILLLPLLNWSAPEPVAVLFAGPLLIFRAPAPVAVLA